MTQPVLFPLPPQPRPRRATPPTPETPPHTGPRPGEPHDQADAELGRQYPYVTPARANAIRREIDARQTRNTTRSTP